MERIVEIDAAFDKRNPDPRKNYGIHGVNLRFILKGKGGAVQFILYTNWQLPHVEKELDRRRSDHLLCHPIPADIGYHSLTPQYEGQESLIKECPYLDGKPCYYDGSALQAVDVFNIMVEQGGEAMWAELQRRYEELFGKE